MDKDIRIRRAVWMIWNDDAGFDRPMDEERAEEILEFELERLTDESMIEISYDMAVDLEHTTPASFCAQWNWLAEHKPRHYGEIPEENRE